MNAEKKNIPSILAKILNSNNFTVGGGSASAIAGAMAAGMVGMVAKLSMKNDYGLSKEQYEEVAQEADELAQQLFRGAEKDEKAYTTIKDAYKLPKKTDEEKLIRYKAISDAGVVAATIPKENGFKCKRVYELAMLLDGKSNPNTSSDLQSAIYLSESGVKGCSLNIEVNLSLIKDEDTLNQFKEDIHKLKID